MSDRNVSTAVSVLTPKTNVVMESNASIAAKTAAWRGVNLPAARGRARVRTMIASTC